MVLKNSHVLSIIFFICLLSACQPATTPVENPTVTAGNISPTPVTAEIPPPSREATATPTNLPPTAEPTQTPEPPQTSTATHTPEPTPIPDLHGQTLLFWHPWGSGSLAEGIARIVEDFNASNEWGITVEAVSMGNQNDLQQAVREAIESESLPNLTIGFPNMISTWYTQGTVAALNPFVNDPIFGLTTEELGAIYPANLASGSLADGTQIGMPIPQSANVLFYNHTWAQELGFTAPPATAEEFKIQVCAAAEANNSDATSRNDGTGGLVSRGLGASDVAAWLFAFGGSFLNDAGEAYNLNTPQMKAVALFLKDLKDRGCWFTTENFPNPEFAGRQALFAVSSTAGIPFQAQAFTRIGNKDEWGLVAFPGPDGVLAINAFGQLISIFDQSPEANLAAWLFLQYFNTPEIQAGWITSSAYYPSQTTTASYLGDYLAANPVYSTGLALNQYGRTEPNLPSWGAVRSAIFATFEAILTVADEAEIDALLEALNNTAAELLAESQ